MAFIDKRLYQRANLMQPFWLFTGHRQDEACLYICLFMEK